MRLHRGQGRDNEQGQNLVELALVTPLLVLLIAGIVDFGGAFSTLISVVNSSREGARYGARFPFDTAGIRAVALQETTLTGCTVSTVVVSTSVRVTVQCPYAPIMGQMAGLSNPFLLRHTTEMRREGL
jgi:Flp pilus assembly protein TadG